MERSRWAKLLGPALILAYLKLVLRGRRIRKATSDPKQLGGDVLIDPTGTIQFHHVSTSPSDRPSISALLDVVKSHPEFTPPPADNAQADHFTDAS